MIYNNFIHGECICNQLPLVKWFLSGDPEIQLPQTEILVKNLDVKILFPNLEKFGESFKLKNLKFLETDK